MSSGTKAASWLLPTTRIQQIMCTTRTMEALAGKTLFLGHFAESRDTLDLGINIRTLLLTTIPDSTSQKWVSPVHSLC